MKALMYERAWTGGAGLYATTSVPNSRRAYGGTCHGIHGIHGIYGIPSIDEVACCVFRDEKRERIIYSLSPASEVFMGKSDEIAPQQRKHFGSGTNTCMGPAHNAKQRAAAVFVRGGVRSEGSCLISAFKLFPRYGGCHRYTRYHPLYRNLGMF